MGEIYFRVDPLVAQEIEVRDKEIARLKEENKRLSEQAASAAVQLQRNRQKCVDMSLAQKAEREHLCQLLGSENYLSRIFDLLDMEKGVKKVCKVVNG